MAIKQLYIKPVENPILAPYILTVVPVSSVGSVERIHQVLREWTECDSGQKSQSSWSEFARKHRLLQEGEEIPFKIDEFYANQFHWASILKVVSSDKEAELHISMGLCVDEFGNPISPVDVTGRVEKKALEIMRHARGWMFWKRENLTSRLMINRDNSGIKLKTPPNFPKCFTQPTVLAALFPLGVTLIGGMITGAESSNLATLFSKLTSYLASAGLTILVAYLLIASLYWLTSRSEIAWVLAKE
jgi:hypothetical protein